MKYLPFLLVLITYSCTKREIITNGWKIIDTGAFTIEVPSGYKYYRQKGIDSFVGEIRGKDLKIFFDYGYYTNKGPLTDDEFFEKYALGGINRQKVYNLLNVFDSLLAAEIMKKIKVVKIDTLPEDTLFTFEKHLATVQYDNQRIEAPFWAWYVPEADENSANFEINIDTLDGWQRKIFFPVNNNTQRSGVLLKGEYEPSINSYLSLGLNIYNANQTNKALILKILHSVKPTKK